MKSRITLLPLFIFFSVFASVAFSQKNTVEPIFITRDDIKLNGKFFLAEGEGPFTTVILLHGLPGNETDVLGLGKKFSESGINALTFNYSGSYGSEGLGNFKNTLNDIEASYNYLHEHQNVIEYRIDTTRIILGGYSYGGGMSLTYAANHPEINTVFSIAGTDHGEFMRDYNRNPDFAQMIDEYFETLKTPNGPVRFDKLGLPAEVSEIGIENIDPALDLRIAAPMLGSKNILLIGGWDDVNVTIENHILPLYRTLQKENVEKVQLVAFQDNHAFKKVRFELTDVIINWIRMTAN